MPAVFPRSDPVVKAKTPSCHDCWCILVFGLVLAGMVCLTLWATIKEGAHIQRLIHPVDYAGRMCGISPGDKPFIYVCGKASAGFEGDYPSQLDLHSKTCVAACPSLGGDVACIGRPLVTPKALDCQDNGCVVNGIQVRKTVTWQISQAVTYQKAYPTDEFRGMICAPKWEAPNDLRSQVLFGDASPLSSAGEAFGSLETAWPVLLAVFGIATLLSILVLLCMTCYAGPVLFMAILLADIMVFILGIFFAIGLFFDPYNTAGWHTLLHASERLDEPIGMIHASMEFIFDPGPSHSSIPFLILVPFGNSLLTLALLAASIYCLMLVLTAGPVDGKGIVIDGEHYTSLYKGVQKPWNGLGWDIAMVVFVAGIIWILELMIGVGQYEWFFQPIDEIAPLEMKKQKEELASTNPEVPAVFLFLDPEAFGTVGPWTTGLTRGPPSSPWHARQDRATWPGDGEKHRGTFTSRRRQMFIASLALAQVAVWHVSSRHFFRCLLLSLLLTFALALDLHRETRFVAVRFPQLRIRPRWLVGTKVAPLVGRVTALHRWLDLTPWAFFNHVQTDWICLEGEGPPSSDCSEIIVLHLPGIVGVFSNQYLLRFARHTRLRCVVKSWRGIGCRLTSHGGNVALAALAAGPALFHAGIMVSAPTDLSTVIPWLESSSLMPYAYLNTCRMFQEISKEENRQMIVDTAPSVAEHFPVVQELPFGRLG
eukprot:g25584.t1